MNNSKPIMLYVDDEELNRLLFTAGFEKSYNIITAKSGGEALEILKGNRNISIVISDMRMIGISGVEFVRTAKPFYKNISYFILSGNVDDSEVIEALNEGLIIDYFKKPMDVSIIAEVLRNIK